MYIFHRTSEEKLQIEAPLLVESWNFISTLKSKNKKKRKRKISDNQGKQRDIIFFLVSWGTTFAVQVVAVWLRKGRATKSWHPGQQHCQRPFSLALPNFLPVHPGLYATSMLSVWRKVEKGTSPDWRGSGARAARSSRSLHKRWPSCHQSLSRCICRPLRCHSWGQTRIPWTEEDGREGKKEEILSVHLTLSGDD